MDLQKYLSRTDFELIDGVFVFDSTQREAKLNRLNVLEELGKGIVWKNIYAHYYRFLFILRWLRHNTILVDVGCGRGWLMDLIYRNRIRVSYIGIDLSLESLKKAARKPYKYPHLLVRADCCEKPLSGEFADYIVCLETIEHNDKKRGESIIQWCKSILKPGGLIFISTPNRKGTTMVFPEDHHYEWEFNELSEFLENENFEIKYIFGCFGKKREIMEALDEIEKELYRRLEPYYSWHVLSPFFATLHPQSAQGAIWLCRKQYN